MPKDSPGGPHFHLPFSSFTCIIGPLCFIHCSHTKVQMPPNGNTDKKDRDRDCECQGEVRWVAMNGMTKSSTSDKEQKTARQTMRLDNSLEKCSQCGYSGVDMVESNPWGQKVDQGLRGHWACSQLLPPWGHLLYQTRFDNSSWMSYWNVYVRPYFPFQITSPPVLPHLSKWQ